MEDNKIDILNYFYSKRNGDIFQQAIDTINSFISDKEHFSVYLWDTEGHRFEVSGELIGALLEFIK